MLSYKIDDDAELRLVQPHQAEQLRALIEGNYDHIREWSSWLKVKKKPIEETREWIGQNLENFAKNRGYGIGIWYRGEMAGEIDFSNLDWGDRKVEIGFWLGAGFQGKGLVTRSCRVLINHAFDELGLNRVEMQCGVENSKSRRIPENLGFQEEGILRQAEWLHDHFVDLVVYGLLSTEWRASAGTQA